MGEPYLAAKRQNKKIPNKINLVPNLPKLVANQGDDPTLVAPRMDRIVILQKRIWKFALQNSILQNEK